MSFLYIPSIYIYESFSYLSSENNPVFEFGFNCEVSVHKTYSKCVYLPSICPRLEIFHLWGSRLDNEWAKLSNNTVDSEIDSFYYKTN